MSFIHKMFRKKLTRNDIVITFFNLVPVAGVWFLGWSATETFIVYALETLIVGLLTVIKLLIATLAKRTDTWYNAGRSTQVGGFFFLFFFIAHFGIFAMVQTSIFSGIAGINPPGKSDLYFFFHFWEYIKENILYMLCGFMTSYIIADLLPFLSRRDYRRLPMLLLMFQPYGRIFVQQFTVILGSMFLSFNLGKIFILIFAIAKISVEIYLRFDSMIARTMGEIDNDSRQQ